MNKKVRKDRIEICEDERKLLDEISKINVKSNKYLKYPPVLDSDPIQAANSLTLEDELRVLELLEDTYKKIREDNQINVALERTLLYSKFNFDWFASFALELSKLNNKSIEIPYKRVETLPERSEKLFLFPPLKYQRGRVTVDLPQGTQIHPVMQYRIVYISQAHEANEFRDGFPAWYSFSNTTIYERYSNVTGIRARIDFNNGEFHYYIAGASDNWKQIVGVPLEMDGIVASLLFKN